MTPEQKSDLIARLEQNLLALADASERADSIRQSEANSYNHLAQTLENNRKYPARCHEDFASNCGDRRRAETAWLKDELRKTAARRTLEAAIDVVRALILEAVGAEEEVRRTEFSTKSEFQVAVKKLVVTASRLKSEANDALHYIKVVRPRPDEDKVIEDGYGEAAHFAKVAG